MRFILTAVVWIIIMSAVTLLFSARGANSEAAQTEIIKLSYPVSFEVTTTFSVEKDPFALNIGEEKAAFSISLDGENVYSTEEGISDRVTFVTHEYNVAPGKHEVFIKANQSEKGLSHAVRVRVLVAGNPLSDETYWFSADQTINASHIFTLETKDEKNEH